KRRLMDFLSPQKFPATSRCGRPECNETAPKEYCRRVSWRARWVSLRLARRRKSPLDPYTLTARGCCPTSPRGANSPEGSERARRRHSSICRRERLTQSCLEVEIGWPAYKPVHFQWTPP